MFGFIRNWFRSRRIKRARLLFEFWDGERFRRVDPWVVWRTFKEDKDFNYETQLDIAQNGESPEIGLFVAAMCNAFGVKRYDEKTNTGMTESEMFVLLSDLGFFFDALKKNGSTSSTASQPTDLDTSTLSDSPTGSEENSASPPTMDCSVSSCDGETPSPPPSETATT